MKVFVVSIPYYNSKRTHEYSYIGDSWVFSTLEKAEKFVEREEELGLELTFADIEEQELDPQI